MGDLSSLHQANLLATETDYGTDAVDAVLDDAEADIIYPEVRDDWTVGPAEIQPVEVPRARPNAGGNRHGVVKNVTPVAGGFPLVGRRESVTTPDWHPLFLAMNLAPTVAGGDVTYNPTIVGQDAFTIYHWKRYLDADDWRLIYTTGVRGNGNFQFSLDEEVYCDFEGSGLWNGVLSGAAEFFDPSTGALALDKAEEAITARTGGDELISSVDPTIATDMTIKIDDVAFCVASMNLNLNWSPALKRCISGDSATKKVALFRPASGSRIGGDMSFVDGDEALDKAMAMYETAEEVSLEIVCQNADTRIKFESDFIQFMQIAEEDQDGYLGHTVPFSLNTDWAGLANSSELEITVEDTD